MKPKYKVIQKTYLLEQKTFKSEYKFKYPEIQPLQQESQFAVQYSNVRAKMIEKKNKVLNYIEDHEYYPEHIFTCVKVYLTDKWIDELKEDHTEDEFEEFITIFMEYIDRVVRIEHTEANRARRRQRSSTFSHTIAANERAEATIAVPNQSNRSLYWLRSSCYTKQ